jgi:chemotaxis protein methyltransferase CheR
VAVPLTTPSHDTRELEDIELGLLAEAIQQRYGYDFRGYARASLRRRFWRRVHLEGLSTISGLQERVLHDPACMERLLRDLSINVTEMFRDPSSYAALRERVFPLLRTHPYLRIWVAGCSSGEEVVSVAIALREADLLDRSRIYATDIDTTMLARARSATFPLDKLQVYTRNYLEAGGAEEFSSYYAVDGDRALFDTELVRDVVYAQHNLVSDRSFNEFHLILCRNVLIYFGRELQNHVLGLLEQSLARRGVLALGRKETLGGTAVEERFEPVVGSEKIYRRRS